MLRAIAVWTRRLLGTGIFLTGVSGRAGGQVRVELEPAIGIYSGFSSFTKPATPGSFILPPETLNQQSAVGFGGQATIWPGSHLGLRILLLTAASDVGPESRDLLNREPVPARVTVAGVEALIPLRAFPSGGRVFLAGGASLVRRSGDAYEDFQGTSDVAGTLGLGSQFRLSPRLSLQGDVRVLLYQLRLTDPTGIRYPSAFQTDLLAHVGLAVQLSPPAE